MSLFTLHSKPTTFVTLFVASFLTLAFLGATEWLIRFRVAPVEPFSQNVDLFWRAHVSDATNAIFGDSEVARGLILDDAKFPNLALGGESLGLTRAKVLAFVRDKSVRRIILNATATTLGRTLGEDDARIGVYTAHKLPLFFLQMEHHRRYMLKYWRTLLVDGTFVSTVRILHNGGQVATGRDKTIQYYDLTPTLRMQHSREILLDKQNHVATKNDPLAITIYSEIIRVSLNSGANVCLLHPPFSAEFNSLASQDTWYEKNVIDRWANVARSFQSGVVFVNAMNLTEDSRLFYDPTHLNERGGRQLGPRMVKLCFP